MTPEPMLAPQRLSMWSQLRPLLGDRSGFAEARVLAIVAEVATALVNRLIATTEDLFFRTLFIARLVPNVHHGLAHIPPAFIEAS